MRGVGWLYVHDGMTGWAQPHTKLNYGCQIIDRKPDEHPNAEEANTEKSNLSEIRSSGCQVGRAS